MTQADDSVQGRTRRLHPMTFLQRLIVSAPGVVLLLLPLLRGGESRVPWLPILAAVFYGCVAVPIIFLQYVQFRYTITSREIRIRSGIFTRRDRSIPVNRVQNIEIEQALLARLFGAAKVKIETAGSTKTEGVLELVSLEEAQEIRRLIRAYQRDGEPLIDAADEPLPRDHPVEPAADPIQSELLLALPLKHALLSGVFRFSLLYIALIFSGLQYLGLDPEGIIRLFERGSLRPISDFAAVSPWTAFSVAIVAAALLSWTTGILVNLNRYYGFRLNMEPGKLHMRHGLLTKAERTVPIRRVQALVFRTNPVMRRFGWWRVELQTMGLDAAERGHHVLAPLVRWDEALRLAGQVRTFSFPATFAPVSPLAVRRWALRYGLVVTAAAVALASFWSPALWLLLALPGAVYFAVISYRNHGFAVGAGELYVRRGVVRHQVWLVPFNRFQVFYTASSFFQRRLALKSLYVDTAGAQSWRKPEISDLPSQEADSMLAQLNREYQSSSARHRPPDPPLIVPHLPTSSELPT